MANPSTNQALILFLTMNPSKRSRTFGPSRRSMSRPDPCSNFYLLPVMEIETHNGLWVSLTTDGGKCSTGDLRVKSG
jgi:hypothetical protein